MRKVLLFACCIAATTALFCGSKTPEQPSDLTADNVEVMGLSGSETVCNPPSKDDCKIYEDGKLVAEGKGSPSHWS